MKKTTFWFIMSILMISALPAEAQKRMKASDFNQAKTSESGTGQISLDHVGLSWDTITRDMGKLTLKQPSTAEFTVTNISKEVMSIVEVTASCGCTVPEYTKEPIKPGQKGTVKLTYDSKISGVFSKTAYVRWSDGTRQILTIKGEVVKPQ